MLAAREFSAICKILNSEDELKEMEGKNGLLWNLLVCDRMVEGDYLFPVMVLRLPVRLRSLFADIESVLANSKNVSKNADTIDIGDGFFISLRHRVLQTREGALSIDLTDKEMQLLQALASAGENGASKEILLKNIWGLDTKAELDTHTLETHVYRLRKKIRDVFGVEMIKAASGGGYSL